MSSNVYLSTNFSYFDTRFHLIYMLSAIDLCLLMSLIEHSSAKLLHSVIFYLFLSPVFITLQRHGCILRFNRIVEVISMKSIQILIAIVMIY